MRILKTMAQILVTVMEGGCLILFLMVLLLVWDVLWLFGRGERR